MDKKLALKEFYKKIKREAVIKSVLSAVAVAFAVLAISSLVGWFTEFGGMWLDAVSFVVSFAVALLLFYFLAFRPTDKYVARRLDALGLDERVITMFEFENENSFIFELQREDAKAVLSNLNSGLIKTIISTSAIVLACVSLTVGVGMTTVYGLSMAEIIPSGKDIIEATTLRNANKYELIYEISESQKEWGSLFLSSTDKGVQSIKLTVTEGDDGEIILPIANDGFVFVGWSDGCREVYRKDVNIDGRMIVTAIFDRVDFDDEDDKSDDSSPRKTLNESSYGNGDGQGNSSSGDGQNKGDGDDKGNGNNPSGSVYKSDQYVYDGKTNYDGAPYKDAYEDVMEELPDIEGLDEDEKDIIIDYFETIGRT